MNQSQLCWSAAIALMVSGNVFTASSAQNLEPEDFETTFSVVRDLDDAGRWGETAVVLHVYAVNETGPKHHAAATLYYYMPDEGVHRRESGTELELTGEVVEKGNGQKKRFVVNFVDEDDIPRAGVSFIRGKRNNFRHRRVLLRLYSSGPTIGALKTADYTLPCDQPPDDDVLEEEEPGDVLEPGEEPEEEIEP